jgi:hypothetical protein
MGGTIRHVDHLRDQMTLQFFGGGTARILFDGRTLMERDGAHASLLDLKDGERVYVETVLDGKFIFARSIRAVTRSALGESDGQVLSYVPDTGDLMVNDAMSSQPLKLRVTSSSQVDWRGHSIAATELRVGTLIAADFTSSGGSIPVASRISILAEPGSPFVFSGRVEHLDLHTGLLVLLNPQDGKNYQVFLDPSQASAQRDLREGSDVIVNTKFDGTRYAVSSLTVSPTPPQAK